MLNLINLIILVMGIVLLIGGIIIVKESIKKRSYEKTFSEACGMIGFGIIICMAWISSMF